MANVSEVTLGRDGCHRLHNRGSLDEERVGDFLSAVRHGVENAKRELCRLHDKSSRSLDPNPNKNPDPKKGETINQLVNEHIRLFRSGQIQLLYEESNAIKSRTPAEQAAKPVSKLNSAQIAADLDNFKSLNDKYGHLVGDEVLCQFGKTLNQAIRDSDQAFRIGGDEFTLIVEGDATAASNLCERILALMAQDNLLNKFQVHTSLGVAQWHGEQDGEALYLRADKALYLAKAAGRRCYRIDQAS